MRTLGIIGVGSGIVNGRTPTKRMGYSHAAGALYNDRARLVAAADSAPQRMEEFRQRWGQYFPGCRYYDSTAAMMQNEELDIVAICTSGQHHFGIAMEVLASKRRPKLVFVEKAPTCSLDEMDVLLKTAREAGVVVATSYTRHWFPYIVKACELIRQGHLGEVKTVVGYCAGHLFSMCSHMTDLICQVAGYDPVAVVAHGTVQREGPWHKAAALPEGYEAEPHLGDMAIEFRNGFVALQIGTYGQHVGGAPCAVVYGAAGRMMIPFGERMPMVYKGGRELTLIEAGGPVEERNCFAVAYEQFAQFLDGGPLPYCSNADWAAVQEIGFAGAESIAGAGTRVAIPNQNRKRKLYMM